MSNDRMERVLEKMKEQGITQFLVSDPSGINYLTGIHVVPMERLFALLLRTDGHHTIFLNYLYFVKDTPFEEVWFSDMDDPVDVIAPHINMSEPLGIDKNWPAGFLIPLQERYPGLKTVLASWCLDGVRAVKQPDEIVKMKKASQINDAVMEKVSGWIREGMTEKQVSDYIDAEYLNMGADGNSFTTIVSFGENAADQHHEPSAERKLAEGECVLIDMGCMYQGYCSDMTRTFYLKKADPEQTRIHDLVRAANEAAEAVIRPGIPICEIDRQAREMIDKAGYSDYWRIRLGHFIGQTDHEYGDVSPNNRNLAEPGMIFSIEPGIYLPGKFGVRIEDLVLVTEDGCEILNKVDKHWKVIGI